MAIPNVTNPAPSEPEFEYDETRLDAARQEIRLVTLQRGGWSEDIRCELRTVSLIDDENAYTALSYLWGNPTPERTIRLNNRTFTIRENLWLALRRLRQPNEDLTMWIDSICINQKKTDERSQQLDMMGEIYKRCTNAVLWLGEAQDITEQNQDSSSAKNACDLLSRLRRLEGGHLRDLELFEERNGRTQVREDRKSQFEAFKTLLGLPWWKRIWVVQEMALPLEITFRYASETFPYETLELASNALRDHAECCRDYRMKLTELGFDRLLEFEAHVKPMVSTRKRSQNEEPITLLELRRLFAASGASEKQDLFYALMGIVSRWGEKGKLKADYSLPKAEAIRKAVHHCLDHEKSPLHGVRERDCEQYREQGYPTWLTDFHVDSISSKRVWGEEQRLKMAEIPPGYTPLTVADTELRDDGTLVLPAKKIDKISQIGHICNPLDELEKVPGVLQQWMGMIEWDEAWPLDPPPSDSKQDGFWRTILNNSIPRDSSYRKPTADDYRKLQGLWQSMSSLLRTSKEHEILRSLQSLVSPNLAQEEDCEPAAKILETYIFSKETTYIAYHLMVCLWKQGLVLTEEQRIGLAPGKTEKGDEVYIVRGCPTPLILRLCGDGSADGAVYTVVGNAYIHRWMDGNWSDDGFERISLR